MSTLFQVAPPSVLRYRCEQSFQSLTYITPVGARNRLDTSFSFAGRPSALRQVSPPSALLITPLSVLATSTWGFAGSMNTSHTFLFNPVDVQVAPPSSLLYTPVSVPAKTTRGFVGSTDSADTQFLSSNSNPRLTARQLSPPSVLLYTPVSVPAKTTRGFVGSMDSADTHFVSPSFNPRLTARQVSPPSALLYTPPAP
jgi:hypothetical protein